MCGIAGWVSFSRDLTLHRDTVRAMGATMARRGPDDDGVWLSRQAALAHRRLSIIDLDRGRQPMSVRTPGGEVVIVYIGETYNFLELRALLESHGHRFTTDSDTEVVLRGYLQWGPDVVHQLNGMYGFAIWDERNATLLMTRDRMGIKPFYYYPTADGVLFGSEPKAILANSLADRVVDAAGLRELVSMTKAPGWALWHGMHEIEPGTLVLVDAEGVRTRTYWKLETHEHEHDREESVAHVGELLSDIVRRQLIADVPRCVLLSGGLDSSAITGLAADCLGRAGERVRTFSVNYLGHEERFQPDPLRDTVDAPYIRDVVDMLGPLHQEILLDTRDVSDPELRRAVITARDMPGLLGDLDPSLYLLSKAIKAESTVALSGESADELFGGYRWFHEDEARWAEMFPWRAFAGSLTADRHGVFRQDVLDVLALPGYIADQYATAVAGVEHLPGETGLERRMRTVSHLNLTRYLRMVLDRKDRMSMAAGLEVRVPFCDHRLVDYVYNAPWRLKSFDGREKSLLRHATKQVLPDSVVNRRKNPYPSTQDPQYAAALQQQAKELLAEPGSAVFDLIDHGWLSAAVEHDAETLPRRTRAGLDQVLDLHHWLDLYRPEVRLAG
ncbi:asparagine synthase (glutamine-hydrolyzing) [Amycolatopsis acidiphila]|uniref:asparagine synthase (glutamine-hydrolyzing) n=1 Tax=Amycolatopsis acidiphila TaxID=715473 RepID=A0A557ZXU4_9PSEU|nr:asparagine synthase (glutamine-hydrolyzing) [Amycolatopsis acidiphila]TVT16839.1 asparagine synthase (glutamine-hydrolyzing) [Amycolatopsis acidiphila]UIJ63044.1 asparagine synthase (glutamine-hydrolyzing) [Amycolatopsis acidiphila]GHG65812.1 asparagine synthetase B [Amycolatopsis acidiphila]